MAVYYSTTFQIIRYLLPTVWMDVIAFCFKQSRLKC